MKIVHICIGEHYVDNFGYQENYLPKVHKLMGLDVEIIASTETIKDNKLYYLSPSEYITSDNIRIVRLPYVSWLPKLFARKLRKCVGLYKMLEICSPDIIFVHCGCTMEMYTLRRYMRKHKNVRLYVDSHNDYINSAKSWFSMNVLHKIIYRNCYQIIEPYVVKFWGTLPLRCSFLIDIYKMPQDKVGFLPQGMLLNEDDVRNRNIIRKQKRLENSIGDDEFVIVTGGKLTKKKNFHLLLDAFHRFKKADAKLYVFGSICEDIKVDFEKYSKLDSRIIYVGWVSNENIYPNFVVGDLGMFPGLHSALWEQAVASGLPCVFKKMKNITQIDLKGNCIFLNDVTSNEILIVLNELYKDRSKLENMRSIAESKGYEMFSYEKIGKRAIQMTEI